MRELQHIYVLQYCNTLPLLPRTLEQAHSCKASLNHRFLDSYSEADGIFTTVLNTAGKEAASLCVL